MKTLFSRDSVMISSEQAFKEMMICEAAEEANAENITKEQEAYEAELNDDFKLKKLAAKMDEYDVCFVLSALIKKIKMDPAFEDADDEMFTALNEMYKVLRKALGECKQQYFTVKFGSNAPAETEPAADETPVETPEETEPTETAAEEDTEENEEETEK